MISAVVFAVTHIDSFCLQNLKQKCRVNKLKDLLRTQGGALFWLTAGPLD